MARFRAVGRKLLSEIMPSEKPGEINIAGERPRISAQYLGNEG
jgi:hypothetical protein